MVVAVNFPQEWLAKYFVTGFEPMRQQMFIAESAFGWERLRKVEKGKTPYAGLFVEGQETGFYHGIGIPLRGPSGAMAGITAAGSAARTILNDDNLDYVLHLCQQFYKSFIKLGMKPERQKNVSLTEREREVLTWYSMGKSQPEIAIIMGVTPHAVKFHLKSIFVKLDVQSDRVAVLKAASMGLIFPSAEDARRRAE